MRSAKRQPQFEFVPILSITLFRFSRASAWPLQVAATAPGFKLRLRHGERAYFFAGEELRDIVIWADRDAEPGNDSYFAPNPS